MVVAEESETVPSTLSRGCYWAAALGGAGVESPPPAPGWLEPMSSHGLSVEGIVSTSSTARHSPSLGVFGSGRVSYVLSGLLTSASVVAAGADHLESSAEALRCDLTTAE